MTILTTRHTSDRYPGWTFEKTVSTRPDGSTHEEWFGTKLGVGYAVSGQAYKGKILGELMTRQAKNGSVSWEAIQSQRNPFEGEMAECIAEAERRTEYWVSKGEKNAYGEYLKLA